MSWPRSMVALPVLLLAVRLAAAQEPTWKPQSAEEIVRLARGREQVPRLLRDSVWPRLEQLARGDTVVVLAEQWPLEWLPSTTPLYRRLTGEEWADAVARNRTVHHLTFERGGGDTLWVGVASARRCESSVTWSAWVWVGEQWQTVGAGRGSASGLSHCR